MAYFLTLLLQLVNRYFFVKYLNTEYLGLNGLFTNMISLLSLSEMGIGTAMIYALYKPVANHNIEEIKSLMHLYKKLYTYIGVFILAVGTAFIPFLDYFIEEDTDIKYISLYFFLYVINAGISYFYTYKRSIIICNQQDYISTITTTTTTLITRIVQIVVLLLTGNFLLYLIVQILFTRIENIVISKIADKKYPYLLETDIQALSKEKLKKIKNNISAMFIHKIGNVIVNATDNLIISKILGLTAVGYYSNYVLIIDAVGGFLTKVFSSITASIGNYIATEDKNKVEIIFKNILFANFWIVSFFSICLYVMFQSFITVWLGKEFLLDQTTLVIVVVGFYILWMRKTVLEFRNATGLFWNDRYKAIIESIVNIIASIPLTYVLGIGGVKLGTIISTLTTAFWIEAYVLYKHYFKKSMWPYLLKQFMYLLLMLICGYITQLLANNVSYDGLIGLSIRFIICLIIPNVIYVIVFCRSDEFAYYWKLLSGLAYRFFSKMRRV